MTNSQNLEDFSKPSLLTTSLLFKISNLSIGGFLPELTPARNIFASLSSHDSLVSYFSDLKPESATIDWY